MSDSKNRFPNKYLFLKKTISMILFQKSFRGQSLALKNDLLMTAARVVFCAQAQRRGSSIASRGSSIAIWRHVIATCARTIAVLLYARRQQAAPCIAHVLALVLFLADREAADGESIERHLA